MRINKSIYVSIPLMAVVAVGCESSESVMPHDKGSEVKVALRAPMVAGADGVLPGAVSVYVFSSGSLSDMLTLNPGDDAEFTAMSDNKVYAISGVEVPALSAGESLSKLEDCRVSMPAGSNHAPDFYTGVGILNEEGDAMEVALKHATSRLDIACSDPKMVLSEVIVENAPASSSVIPTDNPADSQTVTCRIEVGEDFSGRIEDAFTLFESVNPVSIRMKGTYDGDPMNMVTRIPIERNKIYTVTALSGTDAHAEVSVADWARGDAGDGLVILGETAIDMANSEIPAGVVISDIDNTVTLPATGIEDMKIAFRTAEPLTINRFVGETDWISFDADACRETADGYVSSFSIKAVEQPKCAPARYATVVLNGSSDFFLNIVLAESPYKIPTVRMAGYEWMCFNAVSDNIDDQIFMEPGLTVEEMYNQHFEDCVGNYFQYGRIFGYCPWLSYDPTEHADVERDIPWQTTGKMPLPAGYHVASEAEWRALTPPNGDLPAQFTSNGDSIHASVVTLDGTLTTPSANINAKNYKKRYLLFESITTGNKLYIPIMGIKEPSTTEIPSQTGSYRFETRSGYWIKENRTFWLIDYKDRGNGVDGANMSKGNWNYDGFIGVRGIKD